MIKVVRLDKTYEEKFWEHVKKNQLEYYFFIYDWKFQKNESQFFLAIEEDMIKGLMLIFKDSIVQLRGSREAIRELLKHLKLKEVELSAPLDCKDVIFENFAPSFQGEVMLMHLEKGHEFFFKEYIPTELTSENSAEVAELLRTSFPEWWGNVTKERIESSMKFNYWLGIKRDGKIVSVGNTRFIDFGSNIGVVATDKAHQNKGYAKSIVSALVEEIFKRYRRAIIHVLKSNLPAVHVYEKVGFRPYKSYFLIKNAKKIG